MSRLVEILRDGGSLEEWEQELRSASISQQALDEALVFAIPLGLELVEKLLRRGANPNSRPLESGWPPLHTAVVCESPEIIHTLLAAGADLDAQDPDGWTALHRAAAGAYPSGREPDPADMTRLLLELGADPTLRDEDGRTPLDIARSYDDREAIELLTQALAARRERSA